MSSRELIQRIREKSELNRALAGDESPSTGSSSPDLVREIQEQVSRELARRVDSTLERFSQRLERLPASPPPALATDELHDRLGRIQDSVRDLVQRLDRVAGELDAQEDAPGMTTADLRQQLEEWWRDCELERSAAADRAAADTPPASDSATSRESVEAIERLGESLGARFAELRTQLEERIEALQTSFDASAERADHEEAENRATSPDEALVGVRESLETLHAMWAEFMVRIESNADADAPDADPADAEFGAATIDAWRDSVRDEVRALEDRLAERIAHAIESASVEPQPMAIDLDLSALDAVKVALESWGAQWQEWIARSEASDADPAVEPFDANELRNALVHELHSIEDRLGERVCDQLLGHLSTHLDERLARFESTSDDGPTVSTFDPSSLDPITTAIERLEARWDDFVREASADSTEDAADPSAPDASEWRDAIAGELSGLEARLGEKWQELAAASAAESDSDRDADSAADAWRARLDELQARIEARFDALGESWDERWQTFDAAPRPEADPNASASSEEILGRLDQLEAALSERIAEARQWLADHGNDDGREAEDAGVPSHGAAFTELHELEERLNSAVIALTQHAEAGRLGAGSGGVDEEMLDRWEARILDAIQNGPSPAAAPAPVPADMPTPPVDAPVSESLLFARLESLEESVQAFVTRSGETLTQTILDRCLELEHTVPEQVSEKVGGLAASAPPALELPEALVQMPDVVIGLRRDFSLLVHTVNNHLEDAREQTDRIADAVIAKLRDHPDLLGQAGGATAEGATADLDDQVEATLDARSHVSADGAPAAAKETEEQAESA